LNRDFLFSLSTSSVVFGFPFFERTRETKLSANLCCLQVDAKWCSS